MQLPHAAQWLNGQAACIIKDYMSDQDDNYAGLLLEQIRDEVKAIHELVAGQPTRSEFDQLTTDVRTIRDDTKVIKAAVMDQSAQLNDHEHRITRLETGTA
jgi:hypothetical protein